MAIGTVTIVRTNEVHGDQRVVVADVVPTSGANYTQGGDTVPAASLGLQFVQHATANVTTQAATVGPSAAAALVQANGSVKLKCNLAAATGDNASNADLSATLVRVTAYGY